MATHDDWLRQLERDAFWYRLPFLLMGLCAFVGLPIAVLVLWVL